LVIALSGMDGAGKSTQCARLRNLLESAGCRPLSLWVRPGYTPLMSGLKRVARALFPRRLPKAGDVEARARSFRRPWIRRAWIVLSLLELLVLTAVRIRWWRALGRVVLCDRYVWDSLIDFQLLFPDERIERHGLWRTLIRFAVRPDVPMLLWVTHDVACARAEAKNEPFPDDPGVRDRRWRAYELLGSLPRWHRIDARAPEDVVAAAIHERVRAAAHVR
jgi:dTMP kinase